MACAVRNVVLAVSAVSLSPLGTVGLSGQTWDVIDETYGSGPGEVSFNASYSCLFGSVAPPETLSAGKATLSVPRGGGVVYPYKAPTVPAWPGGNADATLEWKLAFRQGGSAAVFFSETPSTASSTWGGIATFDLRDHRPRLKRRSKDANSTHLNRTPMKAKRNLLAAGMFLAVLGSVFASAFSFSSRLAWR